MAHRLQEMSLAGAIVLLVTLFFHTIIPVNATTIGFAYLITVLLIAASRGLIAAVVASVTATLCLNYFFLPPTGTLRIEDPENLIALFAFLASALVASQLSNRAERRTIEAVARKVEMERLYSLSRALMGMDQARPVGVQIAQEMARIFESPLAAIYDRRAGEMHSGTVSVPDIATKMRTVAETGSTLRDEASRSLIASITLGGQSIGSLAIVENAVSSTALNALLNLIAITLDNAHSRELATRAEAARQSEEFKSTLLDGLAHEFKTPLTSIKAAATALLTSTISAPDERQEMLTVVDQEADRLSRLVTETIQLARIEAGRVQLDLQEWSIVSLVESAVRQMNVSGNGKTIDVRIEAGIPGIRADGKLLQLALKQLLDNALKYSQPRSAIGVSARLVDGRIEVSVHNRGEALSEAEQQRVFEKFYRGKNVRQRVAGTGMGLAIARQIMIAHGGDIRVESRIDSGTTFTAVVPLSENGDRQ